MLLKHMKIRAPLHMCLNIIFLRALLCGKEPRSFKVEFKGIPGCQDSYDLSECHCLSGLGRHKEPLRS